MNPDPVSTTAEPPTVLYGWSARRLAPIVLLYAALVFVAFLALAAFVLRSPIAVKALAIGAVGFLVSLVPGVITRVECRLTDRGLERRPVDRKKAKPFETVFAWDERTRVTPTRHGFKFSRPVPGRSALARFWQKHVSDDFSGEVPVEAADRERVLAIVADRTSRSAAAAEPGARSRTRGGKRDGDQGVADPLG